MNHQEPEIDPKALLLFALQHFDIAILADNGKYVEVPNDYTIEVETNGVYRLTHLGKVIAPFADVEALCHFVKLG